MTKVLFTIPGAKRTVAGKLARTMKRLLEAQGYDVYAALAGDGPELEWGNFDAVVAQAYTLAGTRPPTRHTRHYAEQVQKYTGKLYLFHDDVIFAPGDPGQYFGFEHREFDGVLTMSVNYEMMKQSLDGRGFRYKDNWQTTPHNELCILESNWRVLEGDWGEFGYLIGNAGLHKPDKLRIFNELLRDSPLLQQTAFSGGLLVRGGIAYKGRTTSFDRMRDFYSQKCGSCLYVASPAQSGGGATLRLAESISSTVTFVHEAADPSRSWLGVDSPLYFRNREELEAKFEQPRSFYLPHLREAYDKLVERAERILRDTVTVL